MQEPPNNTGDDSARRSDYASSGASTHPLPNNPLPVPPQPGQPPTYAQPYGYGRDRRSHRHFHGPSIVGPVLLIGAGVLFLLNTLEIVDWSIWEQLGRLWPLILIAIGIDLLVGRRRPVLALLLVLLLVGGGAALILYSGGSPVRNDIQSIPLNLPLSNAKSADVSVDFGLGTLTLDGTANSESLTTGTLEYSGDRNEPTHEVSITGDQATLNLRQHDEGGFGFGFTLFGPRRSPDWRVHLNPTIPLTLTADLGTGNSGLDLSQLKVTHLNINGGTGNTTVTFPQNAGQTTTATIDGGVGNLYLKIPESVEARITVNPGIGNINVDSRFPKQENQENNIYVTKDYTSTAPNKLNLKLDVGVGNVQISNVVRIP